MAGSYDDVDLGLVPGVTSELREVRRGLSQRMAELQPHYAPISLTTFGAGEESEEWGEGEGEGDDDWEVRHGCGLEGRSGWLPRP